MEGGFYCCHIEPFAPVSARQEMAFHKQRTAHFIANPAGVVLVLVTVEGAGAVDEQASGLEDVPDVREDLPLPLLAHPHIIEAPLLPRHVVLAEHAFARARDIRKKDIHLPSQSPKFMGQR